jgi:hypothetical protein
MFWAEAAVRVTKPRANAAMDLITGLLEGVCDEVLVFDSVLWI